MSNASKTTDSKKRPQHLCIRPLSVYDLKQVVTLENKCFPPHEAATEAKIKYRLTVCPELCSGLFIREFEDLSEQAPATPSKDNNDTTASIDGEDTDEDPDYIPSGRANAPLPPNKSTIKSEQLIGHIVSTKIYDDRITDRSMLIPKLTSDNLHDPKILENDKVGHVEGSKTLGLHSLVIHPEYQGLKLGSLLVKDYLQKLNQQFVVDKVVIIAKSELVKFYESLGFVDDGVSACKFGGEEWHDCYYILTHDDDDEMM